jgi:hypothetical protein
VLFCVLPCHISQHNVVFSADIAVVW